MTTRRGFLHQAGAGVAATGLLPNLIETTDARYPEYPTIPNEMRERIGWKRTNRWRKEKEDAKWSVSTYEWPWLRGKVRDATDGLVDVPLGGLIAFHIGDDRETWKIAGEDREVKLKFRDERTTESEHVTMPNGEESSDQE